MSPPEASGSATFWSCFTRQASDPLANVYGDVTGERYDYDSNVPNSRQVGEGDVLVLRDEHLVYGWGVVSSVEARPGAKRKGACPGCGSTSKWNPRTTLLPHYRCSRCGEEFDVLIPTEVPVTLFSAYYGENWIEFGSPARARDLRSVFAMRDQQNAIRRLDPARALGFVDLHQGVASGLVIELGEWVKYGGFAETRAKVRQFQADFRSRLLDRFGEVCAVTGRHPREILDAAHLYPYATRPVHDERGGLLFRKDVHRLFDAMLLTVDPEDAQSHVAPALLARYPLLGALDGQRLRVSSDRLPRPDLLASHAESARERWRTLEKELAAR